VPTVTCPKCGKSHYARRQALAYRCRFCGHYWSALTEAPKPPEPPPESETPTGHIRPPETPKPTQKPKPKPPKKKIPWYERPLF